MDRTTTETDLAALGALNNVDLPLRRSLREIRLSIDSVLLPADDKHDLIESFRRFFTELDRPEPSSERLYRYWRWIDELAPTVAHELAQVEAIQRFSLQWGEGIQPKGGFLNERAAKEFIESIANPRIRETLESAYAEIIELSVFEGLRPEGAFDLLYFYRFLAKWSGSPKRIRF